MSRISQTACFIAAYEFCISHLYIAKKFKIFQNFLIICLCTLTLLICTCCLSYFFNTKRPFRNFHSKWPYLLQRQEAFGFLMFYSRSDPEPAFLICVYRYKYKSHNHINTRYCWRQSCFCYIWCFRFLKIWSTSLITYGNVILPFLFIRILNVPPNILLLFFLSLQ